MNFGGAGLTTQLTATGYYTHPNHPAETKDITDQVTWKSSTPECVTVNATGFITSGHNVCSNIPVTASAPGFNGLISGSMTVNVTQSSTGGGGGSSTDVASLVIIPSSQTVASVGQTGQFIAIGTTGAGTTENLSSTAVWTSSSTGVATICSAGSAAPCTASTDGLATATGAGTTTISAVYANADGTSATGTATFTVTGASTSPLQSLAITPGTESILQGQSSQLIAIGTFSSTSSTPGTQNLTSQVTWNSSNTSVASITSGGYVTAVGAGTAVITAIAPAVDGSLVAVATITVTTPTTGSTAEPLTSLAIVPSSQTLTVVNQTAGLIGIGTTSTGTTVNLTNQTATVGGSTIKAAAWASSVPSVASIDPATGIVTAKASGTTAITAMASNPDGTVVTGTATVTVSITGSSSGEPLVSLAIVPSSQTLTTTAQTANLIAIGTTAAGTTVNLTNVPVTIGTSTIKAAAWNSSVPLVASIDPATGIVAPKANGTTAITAIASNPDGTVVTGTATVTVNISATPEPLQSLTIIPGSESVAYPGQQGQFTAVGTTSAGTTVNLTNQTAAVGTVTIPAVVWSSSNKGVATVDPASGLVTAQGQGTAVILAVGKNTDGSVVTATATFAVQNAASEPVTAIAIIPGSQSIAANQTAQFIALGTDGTTGLQSDMTTNGVTWSSSNQSVAKVGANTGLVTPVGPGTTSIIAEYTNTSPAGVVSATASVTVTAVTATPEPLLSLEVIPSEVTLVSIDQTAQFLAIGTTSAGAQEDLTNSVAWTSSEPAVATFNSTGSTGTSTGGVGSSAGLATVVGAGTTAITAVATNPDNTVVTGVATLTCPPNSSTTTIGGTIVATGGCNLDPASVPAEQLATLTVYGTGNNTTNWLITAPSATGVADVIHCGPTATNTSPVCVGTYPIGTKVTLTTDVTSGTFGGWSANCTIAPSPSTATGTNTCTVTLANDETVAAIFN
jgi:hypothetical protein